MALPPGRPVTSAALRAMGISGDLAVHYVRAGWLRRLARGVYSRPDGELDLHASLALLEGSIDGLHVGGKTALDWHGLRHFLRPQPVLDLYGHQSAHLPDWFTAAFPARYRRRQLFDEPATALLCVERFGRATYRPLVSEPERAWLELLSDVGVRQPLSEAQELASETHLLRARVLQRLLEACLSVKTVRLCLQLGERTNAPWMTKLDRASIPTGSASPWVARTREGLLILPP